VKKNNAENDTGFKFVSNSTKTAIIIPMLDTRYSVDSEPSFVARSGEQRIEEASGLVRAIDLKLVYQCIVKLNKPRPATLIGAGSVENLADIFKEQEVILAVIDHTLTPVQQRNLERAWNIKVIDRTGLILEIFGERAKTREGVLQVELAHLNYQKGRLVRSWTHLERQRGGGGFMGGPGETQIESDRRLLQGKIDRLKTELEQVIKTRQLHRAQRQKVPFPIVALVGYTNAGKSTLFNRLTNADVLAADMLFATLDPTLRKLKLPHGASVILSDTVGFISNLPTHLIAAFRATLEEVLEADIIVHVRDIADCETNAQAHDVHIILKSLGVEPHDADKVIEIWNKIDLLNEQSSQSAHVLTSSMDMRGVQKIPLSALNGHGIEELLTLIETMISGVLEEFQFTLNIQNFSFLNWIYNNSMVVSRDDCEDGSVILTVRASHRIRSEITHKVETQAIIPNKLL
jgi:GTPase